VAHHREQLVSEHALHHPVEHQERRLGVGIAPEHVEDRGDVGKREHVSNQ
jgi:hypothetical protein